MRNQLWFCLAILLFVLLTGPQVLATTAATADGQQEVFDTPPTISFEASEILNNMQNYLANQPRFQVNVNQSTEIILPNSQRVHSDRFMEISVERPNRMRINLISAKRNLQLYYDGQNVALYSPNQNYYALVAAQPTINQTVSYVSKQYNLDFPIFDLLQSSSANILLNNVEYGDYLGKGMVNGVLCNQLAFRQTDIDWQIWIADGSQPIPMRIIINDKTQPGEPQTISTFSGWDAAPTFDDAIFSFQPAVADRRIQILPAAEPERIQMVQQQPVITEQPPVTNTRERLAKQ